MRLIRSRSARLACARQSICESATELRGATTLALITASAFASGLQQCAAPKHRRLVLLFRATSLMQNRRRTTVRKHPFACAWIHHIAWLIDSESELVWEES